MAPKRPSTPQPRSATPSRELRKGPPATPAPAAPVQPRRDMNGDVIMGSTSVLVPPSPHGLTEAFGATALAPAQGPTLPLRTSKVKTRVLIDPRPRAAVKKPHAKKPKINVSKLIDAVSGATAGVSSLAIQQSFRFMDLPGEIRNMIYQHTYDKPKQALLVHRPRLASLRSRTRVDRSRAMSSDVADAELDRELSTKSRRVTKAKGKTVIPRETNRPFFGLTQVCQQVRNEYRPIYMAKQEIGMDLTEIVLYLKTFYYDAPAAFTRLFNGGERGKDMPFNGNLTIAVGEKPNDMERSSAGVEVAPLLDLWANSFKIEAGFGRYLKAGYVPEQDGEAKDLYRLFGRQVMRNRSCSSMNNNWRTILRTRSLASVTIHRKPAPPVGGGNVNVTVTVPAPIFVPAAHAPGVAGGIVVLANVVPAEPKPYIHILFRRQFAEPWMTSRDSVIPKLPIDWLTDRGFGGMEHFDIKVGVAT